MLRVGHYGLEPEAVRHRPLCQNLRGRSQKFDSFVHCCQLELFLGLEHFEDFAVDLVVDIVHFEHCLSFGLGLSLCMKLNYWML